MAQQRFVHKLIDRPDCSGVLPQECVGKLRDARSGARPKRRQIKRTKGANLTVSRYAVVGDQLDHGAVEDLDVLAFGPRIAALDQWQVHLIHTDRGYLHVVPLPSPGGCSTPVDNGRIARCKSSCAKPTAAVTTEIRRLIPLFDRIHLRGALRLQETSRGTPTVRKTKYQAVAAKITPPPMSNAAVSMKPISPIQQAAPGPATNFGAGTQNAGSYAERRTCVHEF